MIQQVALVGMVVGLVWGVLGGACLRVLLFPLGLLLFALPLGDRLVPALQDLTAHFAVKMLSLSGVPVLLQGQVISTPRSVWKVAEACSGINYLTASLTLGYVYAGTAYRSWAHRAGLLAGSAIVPLVANALRVYGTILIASLGGTAIAAGTRHYLFGWLVFAIMMGLLFVLCGRWHEHAGPEFPNPADASPRPIKRASSLVAATLSVGLVALAPASAQLYGRLADESSQMQAPRPSLPWTIADRDHYQWAPHVATPRVEFLQTYQSDRNFVKMYVAYYSTNQSDIRLADRATGLFQDPWWAAQQGRRTATYGGQSFRVRETRLEGPASSLLVWSWFWVDGTFTDRDYLAKVFLAKARLFRSPNGTAVMAVATENRTDLEPATILEGFLQHLSLPETATALASASLVNRQ